MRLAKIKNRYLFKSSNPNGTHSYAVYFDRKSKSYRAVGLTHLYVKDNKRFQQVQKGHIMVTKFKEFDVPSGVKNSYFVKNTSGGKININDASNVTLISQRYLSKKQSSMIKGFAKRQEK